MKKDYTNRPKCPDCGSFMMSKSFRKTGRPDAKGNRRTVHIYECKECGRYLQINNEEKIK